jgi:hypothetical protein
MHRMSAPPLQSKLDGFIGCVLSIVALLPALIGDLIRSPLAPLGGNAELSRIELLPLASFGENKEFEPIPLRGTAQLRIMRRKEATCVAC